MLRHKNIKQPSLLPLLVHSIVSMRFYAAGEQAMLYGSIVTFYRLDIVWFCFLQI